MLKDRFLIVKTEFWKGLIMNKRLKVIFVSAAIACMTPFCLDKLQAVSGNIEPVSSAEKKLHMAPLYLDYNGKAGAALLDLVQKKQRSADGCSMQMDDGDIDILLRIAAAEAGTEDVVGKALVMRVVLNRVESKEFPHTVREVVTQKNGSRYQFCPVGNGSYHTAEVSEACYEALDMILDGWDESCGAEYFCRPETAGKWHEENLSFLFQHGSHRFYKEKRDGDEK